MRSATPGSKETSRKRRQFLVRLVVACAAWGVAGLLVPDVLSAAVLNPMGAALALAFIAGVDRVRHRVAWSCTLLGAAVYATTDIVAIFGPSAGLLAGGFVAAYLCLALSLAAFLGGGVAVNKSAPVVKMPRAGRRSIERLAKAA